jgi:hypothetical protein
MGLGQPTSLRRRVCRQARTPGLNGPQQAPGRDANTPEYGHARALAGEGVGHCASNAACAPGHDRPVPSEHVYGMSLGRARLCTGPASATTACAYVSTCLLSRHRP